MAYEIALPEIFKNQGWKLKIRDRERAEPPHISVIKKTETWRFGIREQTFLDKEPPAKLVPEDIVRFINNNLQVIIQNWDDMFPHNPVWSRAEP